MIIGYTQGTYDMFHIGHLNIFRNAKKYCDYLIVGVNSDDLVKQYKNKSVIVPLAERMDIVSSIKYVDEVIECNTLDKNEILKKVHFDKIFIGDDWKGNKRWVETEKEMKEKGIELVFLPHTDGTSSTVLREKLNGY
ncbi:MAG: adenylyltransferase/cytidyltransferase family protein [Clostridia bacterium]|nr:adenylyltransferase/cytidyltransferase family protein [Clostridia bacterium]